MATNLLSNQPALHFAGEQRVNGGDGAPFGDGPRCADSNVRHLGTETPEMAGAASWGPGLAAAWNFAPRHDPPLSGLVP